MQSTMHEDEDHGALQGRGGKMRTSGTEQGYHFEFITVEAKDCVCYYKNKLEFSGTLNIQNGIL